MSNEYHKYHVIKMKCVLKHTTQKISQSELENTVSHLL